MEEKNNFASLEAALFYYGEEVSVSKLAKTLEMKEEDCRNSLDELKNILENDDSRGLTIIRKKDKVQIATKPNLKEVIQKIAGEELKENLTPAALETLAVLAYLGPTSRSIVDYIRGVNSSFILRSLLVKGLVQRESQKKRGAYYYDISFDFLKHVGLGKKEDLPDYEKFRIILERHKENLEI